MLFKKKSDFSEQPASGYNNYMLLVKAKSFLPAIKLGSTLMLSCSFVTVKQVILVKSDEQLQLPGAAIEPHLPLETMG